MPGAWWFTFGESFLSSTRRLPAEILVVESWIGYAGIRAAAVEFKQHGYGYIVSAGGLTDDRWSDHRSSYAEMGERELLRSGVPRERIIVAPARDTKRQRTYESAVGVLQALRARGIPPKAMNVFTLGPHAGRSRLVFAKVFRPETEVGAVDWTPLEYQGLSWWQSSDRAKQFVAETAAYGYELLLNSGRVPSAPVAGGSSDIVHHCTAVASAASPESRYTSFSAGHMSR